MIRVETNGRHYAISFKHEIFKEVIGGKVVQSLVAIGGRWMKGKTTCMIYAGTPPDSVEVARGVSYCSELDNFNKETGRKIALTRALEDQPSRTVREAFWKAYHDRKAR